MIRKPGKLIWEQEDIKHLKDNFYDKTLKEIADDLNVSTTTINRKVRELGLSKRTAEDIISAQYDTPIPELLYHYHHELMMTMQEISSELGVSRRPLYKLMDKYGIHTRNQSEATKLTWQKMSEQEREGQLSAAHQKTRELSQEGQHPFQVLWRDKREMMLEIARNNALKMCENREYNYMTGRTGPLHHNWNPNKTRDQRLKERRLEKHYQWVRDVYERDNYTCQCCGDDHGGNLNAHHLFNYADYPKRRDDVDNGVTLCEECHVEFHKKYGYRNTTRDQFLAFIKNHKVATGV